MSRIATVSCCLVMATACAPGRTGLRIHLDSELGVPAPLRAVDITVRPVAGPFAPEDGIGYQGVAVFDVEPRAPWPIVLPIEQWHEREAAAAHLRLAPRVAGAGCVEGALLERDIQFRIGHIRDETVMLTCCPERCPAGQICVDRDGSPTCAAAMAVDDGGLDGGLDGGMADGNVGDGSSTDTESSVECSSGPLLSCVPKCGNLFESLLHEAPVASASDMLAAWTVAYAAPVFDADGMRFGPHPDSPDSEEIATEVVSMEAYGDVMVCARLRIGSHGDRVNVLALGIRDPFNGVELDFVLNDAYTSLRWNPTTPADIEAHRDLVDFTSDVTVDVLLAGSGDRFYAEVLPSGSVGASMSGSVPGANAMGRVYLRAHELDNAVVVERLAIGTPGPLVTARLP